MRRESRFTRSFPLPAAGSDLRRVYLGLETQPEESKRETQEESDSCPGSGCSLCCLLPVHRAKLWGRYPNNRMAARNQQPFCGVPTQLVGRASLRQRHDPTDVPTSAASCATELRRANYAPCCRRCLSSLSQPFPLTACPCVLWRGGQIGAGAAPSSPFSSTSFHRQQGGKRLAGGHQSTPLCHIFFP